MSRRVRSTPMTDPWNGASPVRPGRPSFSRRGWLTATLALALAISVAPFTVAQTCPPTGWNLRVEAEVSPMSDNAVIRILGPAMGQGVLRMAAFGLPMSDPNPISPGIIEGGFQLDCGGKYELSVPLALLGEIADVHGPISIHMQAQIGTGVSAEISNIWTLQVCETSSQIPWFTPREGGIETLPGSQSSRTWTTFPHTDPVTGQPHQYLVQSSPFEFQFLTCTGPTGIEGLLPVNGQ